MTLLSYFKKLRLLDYIIITTVLLGGIITYQFFNPKEKWIEISVVDEKIPFHLADSLQKGDFELSSSGQKSATVEYVFSYDTNNTNKTIFINVKLKTKINQRTREFEYNNKAIRIGSDIKLNLNSGVFVGKIVSLAGITPPQTTKILSLKIYEEWPWLADSIGIKDGEKDNKGQKVVEIISKEVKPAEITEVAPNGTRVLTANPQKVDITLKVKVRVQIINDYLIYKQIKKLFIGESFPFNTGRVQIWNALITNIE